MALFRITARDREGRTERTIVAAPSESAAARQVRARGYFVLEVARLRRPLSVNPFPGIRAALWPIRPDSYAQFFAQLAAALRGGRGLSEALRAVGESAREERLARFSAQAAQQLARGTPLSEIMALDYYTFPPWVQATVAAAERAGAVDVVLDLLGEEFRLREALAERFSACSVFARVVVAGGIVAATLPTAIVGGQEQWLSTVAAYGAPVLLAAAMGWYLLRALKSFPLVRAVWEHALLALPITGRLLRNMAGLRALRCLQELLGAGVAPETALETAGPTCGHWWMERGMRRAAQLVREGWTIAEALAAARVFPRRVVGLVATGEQAGALEQMLEEGAGQCEREMRASLGRCTRWSWAMLAVAAGATGLASVVLGAQHAVQRVGEAIFRVFGYGPLP